MSQAQTWPSASLEKVERIQRQLTTTVDIWVGQGRLPADVAKELRDYLWLIDTAITQASAAIADIEDAMGRPTLQQSLERVIRKAANG